MSNYEYMVIPPINFKKWIEDNRKFFKPPVGNKMLYEEFEDFMIFLVGGPNSRKDFHVDDGEEFFYMVEGDMLLKIVEDGKIKDVPIKEGEVFLLPPRVPHSPQRVANTVGMVIERIRKPEELDGFQWYCENCNNKLYEEFQHIDDIVQQLPVIFDRFFSNEERRTCNKCGTIMAPPQ